MPLLFSKGIYYIEKKEGFLDRERKREKQRERERERSPNFLPLKKREAEIEKRRKEMRSEAQDNGDGYQFASNWTGREIERTKRKMVLRGNECRKYKNKRGHEHNIFSILDLGLAFHDRGLPHPDQGSEQ